MPQRISIKKGNAIAQGKHRVEAGTGVHHVGHLLVVYGNLSGEADIVLEGLISQAKDSFVDE